MIHYNHIKKTGYYRVKFIVDIIGVFLPILAIFLLLLSGRFLPAVYFALFLVELFIIGSLLETSQKEFILYEKKILLPINMIIYKFFKVDPISYDQLKKVIINHNTFVFYKYQNKIIDYLPGSRTITINEKHTKQKIITILEKKITTRKLIYLKK